MKGKLVALGLATAFLPVAAQAQTANVTLYGRLNLDFEFVRGKTCAAATAGAPGTAAGCFVGTSAESTTDKWVNRLSSNSSRLGIRGTESLGGGLNAIFQIESLINGDTDSGNLGYRETFVGLQGSWGRLTAGRFLMPQDDLHLIFGNLPTLMTTILQTGALWAQGFLITKGRGSFDARPGNSLRYDTPNVAGLTGAVQYAARDSSGNADGADAPAVTAATNCAVIPPSAACNQNGAGDNGNHLQELRHAWVLGANIIYANGPVQIGASFERNHKVRDASDNDLDWTITGAYDFGTIWQSFGLRVAGVCERTKYETPFGDLKRSFWGVSGTIPVGAGKVYLFWGRAGDGSAINGAADGLVCIGGLCNGSNTRSDQYVVTYSYSLSRRTLLYGGWVKLDNRANARYTFAVNAYPIAVGGKPEGIVAGMVHFF